MKRSRKKVGRGVFPGLSLSVDNKFFNYDPKSLQHGPRFSKLVFDFSVTVFRFFDMKQIQILRDHACGYYAMKRSGMV